jgi:hypothetical protein
LPLDETATALNGSAGVVVSACMEEEIDRNTGSPAVSGRGSQRELREEQARPSGVTDRLVMCAGQRLDWEG